MFRKRGIGKGQRGEMGSKREDKNKRKKRTRGKEGERKNQKSGRGKERKGAAEGGKKRVMGEKERRQ